MRPSAGPSPGPSPSTARARIPTPRPRTTCRPGRTTDPPHPREPRRSPRRSRDPRPRAGPLGLVRRTADPRQRHRRPRSRAAQAAVARDPRVRRRHRTARAASPVAPPVRAAAPVAPAAGRAAAPTAPPPRQSAGPARRFSASRAPMPLAHACPRASSRPLAPAPRPVAAPTRPDVDHGPLPPTTAIRPGRRAVRTARRASRDRARDRRRAGGAVERRAASSRRTPHGTIQRRSRKPTRAAARLGVLGVLAGITVVIPVSQGLVPSSVAFGSDALADSTLPSTVTALAGSSLSALPPTSLMATDGALQARGPGRCEPDRGPLRTPRLRRLDAPRRPERSAQDLRPVQPVGQPHAAASRRGGLARGVQPGVRRTVRRRPVPQRRLPHARRAAGGQGAEGRPRRRPRQEQPRLGPRGRPLPGPDVRREVGAGSPRTPRPTAGRTPRGRSPAAAVRTSAGTGSTSRASRPTASTTTAERRSPPRRAPSLRGARDPR